VDGTISTGYGGMYLSMIKDFLYVNASLLGGWGHLTAHRNITYPRIDAVASSAHGSSGLLSHVDAGINLHGCGWSLRPFDSFDYITQKEQAFTEKGAGVLGLSIKKNNAIYLRNELGLQTSFCVCHKDQIWSIAPKISWVREVRVKGKTSTATFTGTNASFTVTGYFPDRSLVSPGVVVSGSMWQDLAHIDLYYQGEFGQKFSDHSFGGQLRFGF
jgi:uncharacterized protein with beta-barrel porin domain